MNLVIYPRAINLGCGSICSSKNLPMADLDDNEIYFEFNNTVMIPKLIK